MARFNKGCLRSLICRPRYHPPLLKGTDPPLSHFCRNFTQEEKKWKKGKSASVGSFEKVVS